MLPFGGMNPLGPTMTGTSGKSSGDEYEEAPSPIISDEATLALLSIVSFA